MFVYSSKQGLQKCNPYEHKKERGNCLLSIPRTEALALPNPVEQTTLEPTPV